MLSRICLPCFPSRPWPRAEAGSARSFASQHWPAGGRERAWLQPRPKLPWQMELPVAILVTVRFKAQLSPNNSTTTSGFHSIMGGFTIGPYSSDAL
jgi:hypothetical protein